MEKFDLVDAEDNIIGTTDKPTAHTTKQLHRVAAVYVFNESCELFVQVHKSSGGLLDHSVGGHVSKGEDYATAASREAEEELGIKQPLKHVANLYSDEGKYLHMFGIYECIADENWNFTPNDEVDEIIPMTIDSVLKMMKQTPEKFTPGFINTMKEYCRVKKL